MGHFRGVKLREIPRGPPWPSPPQPPDCLNRPYRARPDQKGGTLIAEGVLDAEAHRRRLADPDSYRPKECPHCGHPVLHAHDLRTRKPGLAPDTPDTSEIVIRRFRCVDPSCGAVWQVLPAFLPRHLWRLWAVVESVVSPAPGEVTPVEPPPPSAPWVSQRTRKRWRARLSSAARLLVQWLATMSDAMLDAIAIALGLDATRTDLVAAYAVRFAVPAGRRLAAVAGHIHRIEPGLRLM